MTAKELFVRQVGLTFTFLHRSLYLDDMIEATLTRFRTEELPPEVLELEWNRLKPIDQFDELAAVIFDLESQEKARADGLQIPTIDALEKWLETVEEGELSGNESEVEFVCQVTS